MRNIGEKNFENKNSANGKRGSFHIVRKLELGSVWHQPVSTLMTRTKDVNEGNINTDSFYVYAQWNNSKYTPGVLNIYLQLSREGGRSEK